MSIYVELLLLAAVVVFIVDFSGWKETVLKVATRWVRRHGRLEPVTSLKPFTCSLCSVWWCCLAWSLIRGEFSLGTVAASAGLAAFSITIYKVLIVLKEWSLWLLEKISPKWN